MLGARCRPSRTAFVALVAVAIAVASTVAPGASAAGSQWARQTGTASDDYVEAVGATANDVYVAGETAAALPGQVHAGGDDIFLQRYSAAGTLLWTRQFGSTASDFVRGIVVRDGFIYLVGSTFGELPGQASSGSLDGWVRRYEPDGDVSWTVQYGTSGYDTAAGIAVGSGGVWVAGATDGAFPGATSAGGYDVYIRRIGFGGAVQLTRQFGSAHDEGGNGIAARRKRVHVVGYAGGALPGETSKGSTDAFLRTYRQGGSVVRTRQFGSSSSDNARDVAVGLGGVYVSGDTEGVMTSSSEGGWDGFVRKFDLKGAPAWTRQFGSPQDDGVDGLALAGGEVHIGGSTSGAFPGKSLHGEGDAFLRSYDRTGASAGTRQLGTSGDDESYGIGSSSSAVYVGGGTDGTFPGEPSGGMWDGFVQRVPTS